VIVYIKISIVLRSESSCIILAAIVYM